MTPTAHIDEPKQGSTVNPRHFHVSGWIWLGSGQEQIAAVEVWHKGELLGQTSSIELRPDVNAVMQLLPRERTGFNVVGCSIENQPGPFQIEIRARNRDGTRTPALVAEEFKQVAKEQDPLLALHSSCSKDSLGLEIGAHLLPVPGVKPFYTDSVSSFAGEAGLLHFASDARALPIPDNTLDFLCSSHVLEHLPDPLGTLFEWHRVIKPGGVLYLVVPDKRFTFDHQRDTTSHKHLISDFLQGTERATLADINDFIYNTDWHLLRPSSDPANYDAERDASRTAYLEQLSRGAYVDIHYHTFTPDSLEKALVASGLLNRKGFGFEVISRAERFPPIRRDGIGLLLRKHTGPSAASKGETFALVHPELDQLTLPLVCPHSLANLRMTSGNPQQLCVTASRSYYNIIGGKPDLTLHSGIPIKRSWKSPLRKLWRTRQAFQF